MTENLIIIKKSLRKQCPPLTNPADFYMDVLGVDVNDSENSRSEIMVISIYEKQKFIDIQVILINF